MYNDICITVWLLLDVSRVDCLKRYGACAVTVLL
jgi:hypothetical protein